MVHGLEKFKDYFEDFTSNYVFIGGVACDILMEDIGTSFRATKDLDIPLNRGRLHFQRGFWDVFKIRALSTC